MTREEIEAEAKAVKKQLYEMVVTASKQCKCVGEEIRPLVKEIVRLRKLWKESE